MRFCFVTTFYPPYSTGGDAVAVQRLARELTRQGHSVTVVHDLDAFAALNRPVLPDAPHPDDGIDVVSLSSPLGIVSPLIVQQTGRPVVHRKRLRSLLDDGGFDVVNFHNSSLMGGPGIFGFGGSALRVYTAHEHWLVCPTHILWRYKREVCPARQCIRCQLSYRRPPQLWRLTGLMESSSRAIDVFIAMSVFSRAKHREFGFSRDMVVVPPGGGTPFSGVDGPSPHPRPYFFFSGRLEIGKGLQTVLPVLKDLPGVDLLVAGSGSLEAQLQSKGGDQVVFLGQLPPHSLDPYYRHAVATVVPSLNYETFGLVLVESLRCGTPVIARDIGPFPDIVAKSSGGLLYRTDNELLDAMKRFAGDRDFGRQLGERGRHAFESHWQDSVTAGVYLKTVERAKSTARSSSPA
ncbi:MAG: glycosyltransferase family 4 protein [Gemmatimonadaceae bacterium]